MVDVVGDNDNGSSSSSGDEGFEVGRLNNIELRDVLLLGTLVVVMQSIIITVMWLL